MTTTPSITPQEQRPRLSTADYSPWTRAHALQDCFLYWLPVSQFPIMQSEKTWLLNFLARLTAQLKQENDLRCETFLQYKSVDDNCMADFIKYRQRARTLIGMGRRPGATLPKAPTEEQIKKVREEGKPFDYRAWVGDYSYWFVPKQAEVQRELFFGLGGTTSIFFAPDPKTKAPPLPFTPRLRAAHPAFKAFDIDAGNESLFALTDSFLQRSKEMFGQGLEETPQWDGLAFVLPLLDSGHFFAADADMRAAWFDLFDVYLNESVADGGILLAFRKDFEPLLNGILEDMRNEGLQYRGWQR